MRNKKSPAGLGGKAGRAVGNLTDGQSDYTTLLSPPQVPTNKQLLELAGAKVAEADAQGDEDAWLEAYLLWLNLFEEVHIL